jgi:hypothetical protein
VVLAALSRLLPRTRWSAFISLLLGGTGLTLTAVTVGAG